MALSRMSSKEKTVVAILGVVIVLALVGIGILAAQLIGDDDAGPVAEASATGPAGEMTTAPGPGEGGEVTPVATPALEEPKDMPPPVTANQPVAVAEAESPGPLAPAVIANQTLYADHRYEIEIRAADGAELAIEGSWSQAATSSSGQVAAPQIEFFEGLTPHTIRFEPPVSDPEMWGVSVSASLQESLGQTTNVVITIWDVTGVE